MFVSLCRRLSFVAVVAGVVVLNACSPDALELGTVTPPQPLPDPSVNTRFNFEASQMPPVTNGSFKIGTAPITATFTGGAVGVPDNPDLVRSPTQAWLITQGDSASIEFETPATRFEFYFRNEFEPPEPPAARGGAPVVCEGLDFGNDPAEAFGAPMYARGGFNDWAGASSDPSTAFINLGGGTYQAVFEMTAGQYNFKIASEDWGLEYSNADAPPAIGEPWSVPLSAGGSADTPINIPADACYSWTITVPDGSAVPPDLMDVLIEEFTGSGGAGSVGSEVRVYDVLDNVIATFDGLTQFRRIGTERDPDAGESLISRIEIDNIAEATESLDPLPKGGGTCPGIVDPGNDASEAFGVELFARGAFSDWADPPAAPHNFVNMGGGSYLAQFDMLAGTYEYKMADAGWTVEYVDDANPTVVDSAQQISYPATGGGGNGVVTIPADGCYDWQITVIDDSAVPAPTIELLVAEHQPDTGTPGETGIGFVAIDDFEFSATPPTARNVALVYTRPDGNYSGTVFHVSGDIVGGDQSLPCQLTGDATGCFVIVVINPGGTVTYTITNDGVPDDAGEIVVNSNSIVGETIVTFSGSNVPVTSVFPEAPLENEVILFYKRTDDDYDGWGLHLFPITSPDWTVFTGGEYPYAGIDPVLGAYFIIALPGSSRLTAPYSANPDPLTEFPPSLGFIIHRGNDKDPGSDQFVRIAEDGNFIFVRSGVNSVSTTPPVAGGVTLAGAEAHFVKQDTLLWDAGSGVDSVQLLFSANGRIREAGGRLIGVDMSFDLTAGTSPSLPNATHLEGLTPYAVPVEALDMIDVLITGQLLVAGLDATGKQVSATAVQFPLLLDDLFAEAAADAKLGVDYGSGTPVLSLWAPTSTMASVNIYDTATATTPSATMPMDYDDTTGIWSISGTADWDRKYYTYALTNYAPTASRVVESVVTDPYSVNISAGSAGRLVKSQMINLDDADLKPVDWDSFIKPSLDAPEDIVLYELHIRDFSALDTSVMAPDQGMYTAFANGGNGAAHLADMAAAGLTHVHILPAFDIASVNEDPAQRVDLNDPIADLCALNPAAQPFCDVHSGTILEALQSYGPTELSQQDLVDVLRGYDGFNWGYDPVHFNVPEGAYASDPDTEARILEFRTMVKALSDLGLRAVMDQVYNHTNASGHLGANSVLDKVVPGYYHRLDDSSGGVLRESCCDDTAAEHAMMDKFIVDSMVQWTRAYKIDGFRLDLMSFHPLSTMEKARDAIAALTLADDGVDGSKSYIYGEGWNTGTPANDGRFVNARQDNLAGTGIGSFNDRIRDAVRGGGPFDSGSGHIDSQGFISGQYYDPNANNSGSADELSGLLGAADRVRVAMAGGLSGYPFIDSNDSATTGGGIGAGYTDDPEEIVNYISSHDGETLWDIAQYKHPVGTTTTDRVRAHNLGNSLLLLGQGVPFLHAGQELLRSKSMDRNSFDSGDWFNRLDFAGNDNNFAVGLPLTGDNGASHTEITDLFAVSAADPGSADILFASDVTKEFLRIRNDTQLFRLRTSADVVNRVQFHNTGAAQVPGLIVMSVDGCLTADYTPEYRAVVAVFNATTTDQVFDLYGNRSFSLHPTQVMSVDAIVAGATHDVDGFHVPPRTTAVFVEAQDGSTVCGFGANFAESTAYVTGDFNNNAFTNAMVQVGDSNIIEATVTLPVAGDQRYRILSSDSASINCGGPAGAGALFTPASNGGTTATTLTCGANPDELSLDAALEGRYKFSLDTTNILNPALVYRAQTGTGFPIAGGGCGVSDAGNNNGEFFGENMFVRGSMNDWADPPLAEYQLINTGPDFQLEAEIPAGEYLFQIASADWAPQYGDSATAYVVGETQTLQRGGFGTDTPLTLPEDSCYNFNVLPSTELDMGDGAPVTLDLTVTLKPQDTGEPTDTPLVRGGFNGFGETDPMAMVGDTLFEAIVSIATAGDYEFKIASADWAIVNCGGPHADISGVMDAAVGAATTISCGQNPANLLTTIAEAGDYTFRLNSANRSNPTLTIESFLGAGFNSTGFAMPSVYLKGDFNAFGLDNVTTAAAGGRLYFTTVNLTAGMHEFRFDSEDGVIISCGTPANGSPNVAIGTASTIACGQNLSNLSVDIATDGDYQFRIDAGVSGTARAPILTITQQ